MKAQIFTDSQIISQNQAASDAQGKLVDEPAIKVTTYCGFLYCKRIEFTGQSKMFQNSSHKKLSIWTEAEFEDLIIDGQKATKQMLTHQKPTKSTNIETTEAE